MINKWLTSVLSLVYYFWSITITNTITLHSQSFILLLLLHITPCLIHVSPSLQRKIHVPMSVNVITVNDFNKIEFNLRHSTKLGLYWKAFQLLPLWCTHTCIHIGATKSFNKQRWKETHLTLTNFSIPFKEKLIPFIRHWVSTHKPWHYSHKTKILLMMVY